MEKNDIVDTLFGCQTTYGNCVAYCRKKGKYMTAKIMRGKGCLGKQCHYLDKKEHHYWEVRDYIKNKKKENKG